MEQYKQLDREKEHMVMHVFNPDHDLALAFGKESFTPPAAGRGMRADLAFLPAIWAEEGDRVISDNPEMALEMSRPLLPFLANVEYVAPKDAVKCVREVDGRFEVRPWGWNHALRRQLLRAGVPEACLPCREQIDRIRELSHRATSIPLLHALMADGSGMVGEREVVTDIDDVTRLAGKHGQIVVKSPWSSSGRGVRFAHQWPVPNVVGFVRNIISRQGSIIVEPCYEKEMDFAMEFVANGKGKAKYRGLSLFHTVNGAYVGNLLAEEEEKVQRLAQFVDPSMLRHVAMVVEKEVGGWCDGCYAGPFGVDMMVVRHPQGFALHPCVEVNLRRTMGHVALDLTRTAGCHYRVMRIVFLNGKYQLLLES